MCVCDRWSIPQLWDVLRGWIVIVVDLEPLGTDSCNILGIVPCEEDIIVKLIISVINIIVKLIVSGIDGTLQRRWQLEWNIGNVSPIATWMPLLQIFNLLFCSLQLNPGEGVGEKYCRI